VRFGVLGPLEVSDGDGPVPLGGPKQRVVLAHLVLGVNQVVATDRLIDAVWGESLPEEPTATLRVYVSRLRSALGQNAIEGRPPGYVLHAERDEVDAFRFEELVREARRGTVDPRLTVNILDEALELWRGPALGDLATESSLSGEIARLEELHLQALEERLSAQLALGRHADVIGELEALTAAHPLRERVWELLMLALYRSGRQADALGAYQRARELLADELGIDPNADLQGLQEKILRHDPALDLDGRPLRGYRLLEKIGEGSFGVVHRAIQPHAGREVAVKAINPELANDPAFVRRFEAEAQIVARLENPHIVPLYDYWRDPDGAYLVMRYLSGGSLRRRLEEEGSLQPADVGSLVDQVAQALATAHRQGIVHRDVKPENVLLDAEGNAYLTDFGIAKDISNPQATRSGPLGTPVYLSPEQIRGEPVSPRTDIYALGVLIFEALTGRQPFPEGSIATLLHKNLNDPLPSVRDIRPELPGAVDEMLALATAKDPALRFADASSLAEAFRASIGPSSERTAAASAATNPFKGLRPFVEADAGDFFGREALVERMVARLAEDVEGSRFLVVVGPSGSGKSSAVRAGLVPALRRDALEGSGGWFYVEMAPGAHPLEELEVALLRVAVQSPASLLELLEGDEHGLHRAVHQTLPTGATLMLVIDQLEEVFTLVEDEAERRRFLDGIRAAVTEPDARVRVVTTLRADFYDRPLAYRGFAELVRSRTEPVVPLSPEELERAIGGPAENVGIPVEPALVAQVVADVAEQPGALPLMQYALTELFESRADGVLSVQAYREIGGVSGALARRAEQLFEATNAAGMQAAEQLFLRLVALGEGTEDTRRRVSRSELDRMGVDGRALDGVIDAFARHRLLSLDRDPETREPTVEVAHEALLREWDRLRAWIDAARDDLRTERRLAAAAAEWEAGGRDPSFLLRGSRLEQLATWASTTNLAIAQGEREFLDASLDLAEVERAAEEERTARERILERRSLRRLRTAVAVFAVAALVAAGLTVVATRQSERAEAEARVASAGELAAASIANLENDQQLSLLLAIEAVQRTRSVDGSVQREAEEALHRAVTASRIVRWVPGSSGSSWEDSGAIDWGPTGLFVMSGVFASEGPRSTGVIDLRDQETGMIVRSLPGNDAELIGAAFSPDGSMLATTAHDGLLKVWDLSSGQLVTPAVGGPGKWAVGPSFSADGSRVAGGFSPFNGDPDGVVRVVDLSTDRVLTFPSAPFVNDVSISPDGRRIVAVGGDPNDAIHLIDVKTAHTRRIANPIDNGLTTVAWSPDGRHIAMGGWDPTVAVTDANGRLEFLLRGHSGSVHWIDWSPDATRLLTGSVDGTAKIWKIDDLDATEVQTLSARAGSVTGVAFSPDGTRVMTRSHTRVMDIWDVGPTGDAEVANIGDASELVDFLSDGHHVATSGRDGSLNILDLATGELAHRPIGWFDPPRAPYSGYDFSPDGRSVAVFEGGIRGSTWAIRDVETGTELLAGDRPHAFDWSPDGRYAAVATPWSIAIVDVSGREVARFEEAGFLLHENLAFGPRGLVAVAGTDEGHGDHVKIWNWTHGEVIAELPSTPNFEVMRFDADGSRIALGTADTTIWDVGTERLLLTLPSSQSLPNDIAFSPDGSRLAEGDPDGTVRVFDTSSGELLLVLRAHDTVGTVAFSPDGSMLATQGDGIVRIWALDIDDLLEIARGEVTRPLTDEECRQYLHVESCPAASSSAT
jgi:WD40 repeat protein/DNA-binding SARP family transcriptional activator